MTHHPPDNPTPTHPNNSDIPVAITPTQPHTPAEHKRTSARLEEERRRVDRVSKIRQFVFGSLDGLLVPLGVVSGVAGGTGNINAVIVAGLAEAFAGALSMGFGEFLAGRAEAQVQQAEIDNEIEEIRNNAAYEFEEMIVLLENEGVRVSVHT